MTHTSLWLLVAIMAPTFWALTNVLDGALRKKFIKDDLTLTWLSGIIDLPYVFLFFWLSGWEVPDFTSVLMIVLAGFLWIFPVMLYFRALEHEEPSRVALMMQMLPLFALLFAHFLIGESLSAMQWLAFLVLIGGGSLAALKKLEGVWHLSKALLLIPLATMLWSLSDVLFKKFEMSFDDFGAAFALYFLSSWIASALLFLYAKRKKKIGNHVKDLPLKGWLMIFVSASAGNFGVLCLSYALTLNKASLTTVLIGAQPLLVLILGFILSRFIKEVEAEKLTKESAWLKGGSFLLILVGLILLNFF